MPGSQPQLGDVAGAGAPGSPFRLASPPINPGLGAGERVGRTWVMGGVRWRGGGRCGGGKVGTQGGGPSPLLLLS